MVSVGRGESPGEGLSTLEIGCSYLNRLGQLVDIYGEIVNTTIEYRQGWRFYGRGNFIYNQQGRISDSVLNDNDLVRAIHPEEQAGFLRIPDERTWIDLRKSDMSILVKEASPHPIYLTKGRRYLNRMGFVSEIIEGPSLPPHAKRYRDAHGGCFYEQGHVFADRISMSDIAYELSRDQEFNMFGPLMEPIYEEFHISTSGEVDDTASFFSDLLKRIV